MKTKKVLKPNESFDKDHKENRVPMPEYDIEDVRLLQAEYKADLEDLFLQKKQLEECLSHCHSNGDRQFFGELIAECDDTIKKLKDVIALQEIIINPQIDMHFVSNC